MSGFDLGSMTTLLPVAALVFAFIQDRVTPARSDVRAVVLGCADHSVRTGLTNVGNRPAIIRGGVADMVAPDMTGISRQLQPLDGKPFVLEPQKTVLSEFQFIMAADSQPSAMPPTPDSGVCRYDLKLGIADFDGRKSDQVLEPCKCPPPQ